VRVAITPLIFAFSPLDTPYANPTNKQHSNAVHVSIGFHVRNIPVVHPFPSVVWKLPEQS
jgi:hypothetical protein